jgi:hypothetical protein
VISIGLRQWSAIYCSQQHQELTMDLTGTLISFFAFGVCALGYLAISRMLNGTDKGDGLL